MARLTLPEHPAIFYRFRRTVSRHVGNKGKGRWTTEEHEDFVRGLEQHGRNWGVIAERFVPTRTHLSSGSHALAEVHQQARKGRIFPEEVSFWPQLGHVEW